MMMMMMLENGTNQKAPYFKIATESSVFGLVALSKVITQIVRRVSRQVWNTRENPPLFTSPHSDICRPVEKRQWHLVTSSYNYS